MVLIGIVNDLNKACSIMFNDFDENYQETTKCLMAGDITKCDTGLIYYVVDLMAIPAYAENGNTDYSRLDRYYIFVKENRDGE